VTDATVASIMSSNTFCSMVELRINEKGMSYLEAITDVCEKTGLEFENVSKLMTPTMRKLRFNKFQERGWKHEPLDVMFL